MPEKSSDSPPVRFLPASVDCERQHDGVLLIRSPVELPTYPRCLGEYLEYWGREKPFDTFLAEREGSSWRILNWSDALSQVRAIASSLLGCRLSASRPVAILSSNSINHALISLAAMHVGIPVAPISPAYSLMSKDFGKLTAAFDLLQPGLVFVEDPKLFIPALNKLKSFDFRLVVSELHRDLVRPIWEFRTLQGTVDDDSVTEAFDRVEPDTIAKFLLTSGSTGEPKAVINTQRMLCANQAMIAACWPFVTDEPPVLVDWLPWNHTFGGNHNFNLVLAQGGQLFIDEGKPTPELIEKTVRNLRDVSPTIYLNAPRGYDVLMPYLESDASLRSNFFRRLKVIMYAAAALPAALWERLERQSISELGYRVRLTSCWGSTETAPMVTSAHFETIRPSVVGLPGPGCEVKMIPIEEDGQNYELRVRGANVTPGYWKRDDLTREAFDDEGYYKIGDAGRFADPADPSKGLEFAGRLAEEFKLSSGTWVHVGALRVRAISALSPVAQDVVVTGHDRDEVGFLIIPNYSGCRGLCHEADETTSLSELFTQGEVIQHVVKGLRRLEVEGGGSSNFATRAMFLKEKPSIDAGEITDKGYINQRAVLERRRAIVEHLYEDPVGSEVILLRH